jgi:hypothetical protein
MVTDRRSFLKSTVVGAVAVSAAAAATMPAAPLAPCGWPIIDFTDEPARRSVCAPNS